MTDKDALCEIVKEEKRLIAANCSSGKMLAKSARDYFRQLKNAQAKFVAVQARYKSALASLEKLEVSAKAAEDVIRSKNAELKKLRTAMFPLRKTIKAGDSLKHKENIARLRLMEKLKVLKTMTGSSSLT